MAYATETVISGSTNAAVHTEADAAPDSNEVRLY